MTLEVTDTKDEKPFADSKNDAVMLGIDLVNEANALSTAREVEPFQPDTAMAIDQTMEWDVQKKDTSDQGDAKD